MNPREVAELRDRVARARLRRAGDPRMLGGNPARRGKTHGRIIDDEFVATLRRSIADGMTVRQIAVVEWKRLGYASLDSCMAAFYRALGARRS